MKYNLKKKSSESLFGLVLFQTRADISIRNKTQISLITVIVINSFNTCMLPFTIVVVVV